MKNFIYCLFFAALVLAPVSSWSLPLIDAEIALGGWLNSPDGSAGYKGDDLSLESDLGYEDETEIFGRMRLELPLFLPNVTIMATELSFDEDNTIAKGFDFGDSTFTASTKFHSKLELDHYDIAVSYGLPFVNLASLGKFQADIGVNLRIMDIEASVEQVQNSVLVKEKKDATIPIPMAFIYLRLEPVSGIAFEAEARALAIGDNSMTSIIGRARYHIFGPVFIAGGYRFESLDIDDEDIKIDTDFQGPFFEAGFKF